MSTTQEITTVQVKIAGTSPFLMAAIPPEFELQENPKVLKGTKPNPREEATRRLYLGSDGKTIIIPGAMLWKAIIQAGQFHKVGRKQLTTRDNSILPGSITLPEDEYPITPQEWEVYYAPITNQVTKGKSPCWRPRFNVPWGFDFTLQIDSADFDMALIRQVVDDAGRRIGIGSFRPECKGPFGKFRVECWTVL